MIKKSDQDFVRKLRLSSTVQCTSTYENWESRKIVCHFLLLQIKHILFVGENTAGYRRHKNAPSNATENQTMPSWQEPVLHSSPGKGGSVIHGI